MSNGGRPGKLVCLWCGVKMDTPATGCRKFCGSKCAQKHRYSLHSDRIKKYTVAWAKKNPEKVMKYHQVAMQKFLSEKRDRFNKLMLLQYYRRQVAKIEKALKVREYKR